MVGTEEYRLVVLRGNGASYRAPRTRPARRANTGLLGLTALDSILGAVGKARDALAGVAVVSGQGPDPGAGDQGAAGAGCPGTGAGRAVVEDAPKRSGDTALLHRGGRGLYSAQFGFISREDAIIALAEPDIEPCQTCNPQTGLQPQ
ncbi:DUF6233 domain-containing protein [Streptomyces sp. sk2.1]|uniref:DUF6233 domain-containing protein n=1 Tax=Streptomyces sp. sk2.1 TaxID=2478959 RepID=UPI0021CCA2DE|nr:DUF6233 domain-containing protein [Streptomyces sp. sk2.1]